MKLHDDDYTGSGVKLPTVILIASVAIFAVLAIVLAANSSGRRRTGTNTANQTVVSETETTTEEGDKLTASDLDFWNMYKDDTGESDPDEQELSRREELEQREQDMNREAREAEEAAAREAEQNADPSQDGKHTLITYSDGTTEWVAINSSFKLNTYEDTSFQASNGIIGYYVNGRKTTKTGVDISQYTTDITWSTLAGEADYVMIRIGARGYDTGKIIADTAFINNVVGAAKAGIPYGFYFSSQAVTEDEVKEEAAYVISQLTAAKAAVEALNTTSETSGTQTQGSVTTNSTPSNLVRGVPTVNGTVSSTATDNSGNTTTVYSDGTAVTKYTNGNIVTAYSDGGMITNNADGSIVKKDNAGNTITIDTEGNYTITNQAGVTTASGKTTLTTGNTTTVNTQTTTNTGGNNTTPAAAGTYTFRPAYPVAVQLQLPANDTARIERITVSERSNLAKAFCDAISTGGYTPMVWGNKEMLLKKLNLAVLNSYDIWVSNEGELPDYPYLLTMWRYSSSGNLMRGLKGEYGVSVGFVDYTAR